MLAVLSILGELGIMPIEGLLLIALCRYQHTRPHDSLVRVVSGLAIRFPKFTGRYGDDRSREQATTREIIGMYRSQLKKLSENPTPETT